MSALRIVAVLIALLAFASPLPAQLQMPLWSGDLIRVRVAAGGTVVASLVAVEDERLRIRTRHGPMDLPLAGVRRLEVSVGRQHARGALVGAGVGLVGGVAVGVMLARSGSGSGGANLAMIGLPLFTIPAGAVLGALAAPHRYLTVARPYRMATSSGGGDATECCR